MKIPAFSEWMKFSEYKTFSDRKLPGVYLLSHFYRKPSGEANPKSGKIIYVGETTKQTIAKRLYQFSQSAFNKKKGHSGGWTYSEKFLDSKIVKSAPPELHLALLPVDKEDIESAAYIKVVERLIIWEFYQNHGEIPKCNSI